ncbi:hypothetical protein QFZ87_001251 [Bacillus sp. SLBN-46]|uniref:hypothetical protein n=1 Tax=Bacillus sp. SLBN-46 TaxID=3042283 RepID=UPI00285B406B|nr:hypothetical protein [Bacillus sp. SLBN-46]MDR6121654.1 hypothetical protein [Bacillus sp. SLBN-46]
MKKTIITGALAAALIVGGGTGVYKAFAQGNQPNPAAYMQQQGINMEQMTNSMKSGTIEDMQKFMEEGNVNFGQMKPYMKQMHPDLTDQQLEEFYKGMHGTGGSSNSANFQGMMGNENL